MPPRFSTEKTMWCSKCSGRISYDYRAFRSEGNSSYVMCYDCWEQQEDRKEHALLEFDMHFSPDPWGGAASFEATGNGLITVHV